MAYARTTCVVGIVLSLFGCSSLFGCRSEPRERDEQTVSVDEPDLAELDNAGFRTRVITFVRNVSAGGPSVACNLPPMTVPLHVAVSIYSTGKLVGRSRSTLEEPCAALTEATRAAVEISGLSSSRLARARFVVEFTNPDYAIVEFEGKGVEFVKGQVPVRTVDKASIQQHIDDGTEYLLRVMDPRLGGVHKYYYAPTDSFDDRLHTIYTASTIYTLLAIHARNHDERLREPIERAAQFLLSMQRIAPGQAGHGAFHYSVDLQGNREPLFVVGTTSKSIFTLIELHEFNKDPAWLEAARLAGDWLLTMQDDDGSVSAKLDPGETGELLETDQESTLYTGQVLSALSRLYEATSDPRYLEAASRTARYLIAKKDREGCYVGDDYRSPNPVSSSWLILSLFDFARVSNDSMIHESVLVCADQLLERQLDVPEDIERHGRWSGSLSSSGNGWLAEVLSILYLSCPKRDSQRCLEYRDAVVRLFRVLMQHTYSLENAFVTKNPDMAKGGLFWNTLDRNVRTDSVCHALNAYVFMVDQLPDGLLIELPEPPLSSILPR